MQEIDPPNPPLTPPATIDGADGTRTIGEIVADGPGNPVLKLGKQSIKDAGRRLAQIHGLKPGSSSIRSKEMIEEMLTRLNNGETITSILCDVHMPAPRTLWNWCDADEGLSNAIKKAQAQGQRALADIRMDIAAGGTFSTGDARRDDLLIKAINANIGQRNRAEFGERVQVDHQRVNVMLPDWAVAISTKPLEAPDDTPDDDPSEI